MHCNPLSYRESISLAMWSQQNQILILQYRAPAGHCPVAGPAPGYSLYAPHPNLCERYTAYGAHAAAIRGAGLLILVIVVQ